MKHLLRRHLCLGVLGTFCVLTSQQARSQEIIRSTYTYKVVGDLRIRADVYRKADEVVRPAILWLHGGGLILGNRRTLNPAQAEQYLNAGYVVVSIDYRLA